MVFGRMLRESVNGQLYLSFASLSRNYLKSGRQIIIRVGESTVQERRDLYIFIGGAIGNVLEKALTFYAVRGGAKEYNLFINLFAQSWNFGIAVLLAGIIGFLSLYAAYAGRHLKRWPLYLVGSMYILIATVNACLLCYGASYGMIAL